MEMNSPQESTQTQEQVPPPTHTRIDKKNFLILLGGFLILGITIAWFLSTTLLKTDLFLEQEHSQNQNSNQDTKSPQVTQTTKVSGSEVTASVALQIIESAIKNDKDLSRYLVTTPAPGRFWWISDDNWSINVENAERVVVSIPVPEEDMSLYSESPFLFPPKAKEFQFLVSQMMSQMGYVLDTRNSSEDTSDTKYYDYLQAFTNGDNYCVSETNADIATYEDTGSRMMKRLQVSCVTKEQFKKAYDEQLPFLKGLSKRDAIISNITVKD
ncbi:MAG: hypothetical protein HYV40_03880 [Candidatus Levybacteria bacterium]|nr:hypothetical protein [Candidatus Levybacteria bacterium]